MYDLRYLVQIMQVNYTVKGQGNKNLILLHGWGGTIRSLSPLQDELIKKADYRVYNIEWSGFGDSKLTGEKSLTYDDYVDLLRNFIETFEISKPVLIGHSFGGKVAIGFALKYPKILSSLVLINSSGIKPTRSLKKVILYIPTKLFGAIFSLPGLRNFKSLIRKNYYRFVVRETDYLVSETMQETMRNVLEVNLDEKLDKVDCDTLLVWGENDTYTPLWMGKKMDELIPKSRIEVIKNAKHNLPLVNPEIVASLIRLFVR